MKTKEIVKDGVDELIFTPQSEEEHKMLCRMMDLGVASIEKIEPWKEDISFSHHRVPYKLTLNKPE
jgi:hypothetical protein